MSAREVGIQQWAGAVAEQDQLLCRLWQPLCVPGWRSGDQDSGQCQHQLSWCHHSLLWLCSLSSNRSANHEHSLLLNSIEILKQRNGLWYLIPLLTICLSTGVEIFLFRYLYFIVKEKSHLMRYNHSIWRHIMEDCCSQDIKVIKICRRMWENSFEQLLQSLDSIWTKCAKQTTPGVLSRETHFLFYSLFHNKYKLAIIIIIMHM